MNIFDFDLVSIISFTVSPLELMLRSALMYCFLFVVVKRMYLEADGEMSLINYESKATA